MEGEISALERSASVMRKELHNLRKQVESLKHAVRSEVKKLRGLLTQQDVAGGLFRPRTPPLKVSHGTPTLPPPPVIRDECPQGKIGQLSDLAVGRIRTCFKEKNGTPRQPSLCTMATGVLTIEVFTNPSHSLEGLQEYSHVWLIFVFHKNSGESSRAKVRPPRLDGRKVGVFASRSPHRPCPLGLTLAKLEQVEGNKLHLTGIDLVDGTPILDVKPYVPNYDTPVAAFSSISMATGTALPEETKVTRQDLQPVPEMLVDTNQGSHGGVCSKEGEVRTAGWLRQPPVVQLNVKFLPQAEEQLRKFKATIPEGSKSTDCRLPSPTDGRPPSSTEDPKPNTSVDKNPFFLEAFRSTAEARRAIIEILQQDPRSVYRRNHCKGQSYRVSIDNLNLSCQFEGNTVIVEDILPKVLWERHNTEKSQ